MKKHNLFTTAALAAALTLAACGGKDNDPGGGSSSEYTVTVTAESSQGMASADKVKAAEGMAVTLTAIPADKYAFVKWTVTGGGVTLYPEFTSNPASFTMPAGNVAVTAEFVQESATINGVRWATRNVAAPGTFAAKPEDYGMFYQWDIKKGWSATTPGDGVAVPGWNTTASTAPAGGSWSTSNDPCPTGWRVPTKDEQESLLEFGKVTHVWTSDYKNSGIAGYTLTDDATGASIFLPAAGRRDFGDGTLYGQGFYGYYWSGSSPLASSTWNLNFSSGIGFAQDIYSRSNGFSVRCVRP